MVPYCLGDGLPARRGPGEIPLAFELDHARGATPAHRDPQRLGEISG